MLIIEYESLWRLQNGKYDLIVNDEYRSIITAMNSSTNGSRKALNYERYEQLIIFSDKNVFLDAMASIDSSVRSTLSNFAAKRASARVVACISKAKEAEGRSDTAEASKWTRAALDVSGAREVEWVEPNLHRICRDVKCADFAHVLMRMCADAAKGRRIGVACCSKRIAEAVGSVLAQVAEGGVGLWTSDSGNEKELEDLEAAWDQ